jgi:hypothetical protein
MESPYVTKESYLLAPKHRSLIVARANVNRMGFRLPSFRSDVGYGPDSPPRRFMFDTSAMIHVYQDLYGVSDNESQSK